MKKEIRKIINNMIYKQNNEVFEILYYSNII